jgi:RNA recognition motif-containing protein
MRIYVGNLPKETTEDDLRPAFEEFGQIETITIIKDKYTGQSKGFGFVDIPSKEEGLAAIEGMNNKEFNGKILQVNEARPRPDNYRHSGGRDGHYDRGRQGGGRGRFAGDRGKYSEYRGRRGSNR